MRTVKVFQIGLGSFGRHGFEKFVEMENYYSELDVELVGVCDTDFEKVESAERFAESQGIEIETYGSTEAIYRAAEEADSDECKVLIYDAGPTELHSEHIYRSLKNGFFHLAEKPPSMTREEHIHEKKLMLDNDVRFTVDFIERESPVVKKALDLLEDEKIDSIEIFRESTIGVQKLLQPIERSGVKGGAVLDKMCHEAYLLDLLDEEMELESVKKQHYMPFKPGSDSFMSIRGGKTSEIGDLTAAGMCKASISSGDVNVSLHGSWLGISEQARIVAEEVENLIDYNPVNSGFSFTGEEGFLDDEARFFIVRGSRNLLADMLNKKLFDLDTGGELETPNLLHDQLYRVLESSVRCAAGLENNTLSEDEIDRFMNLVFDVSESYDEDLDTFDVLQEGNERVRQLILDNVFEAEASSSEV